MSKLFEEPSFNLSLNGRKSPTCDGETKTNSDKNDIPKEKEILCEISSIIDGCVSDIGSLSKYIHCLDLPKSSTDWVRELGDRVYDVLTKLKNRETKWSCLFGELERAIGCLTEQLQYERQLVEEYKLANVTWLEYSKTIGGSHSSLRSCIHKQAVLIKKLEQQIEDQDAMMAKIKLESRDWELKYDQQYLKYQSAKQCLRREEQNYIYLKDSTDRERDLNGILQYGAPSMGSRNNPFRMDEVMVSLVRNLEKERDELMRATDFWKKKCNEYQKTVVLMSKQVDDERSEPIIDYVEYCQEHMHRMELLGLTKHPAYIYMREDILGIVD